MDQYRRIAAALLLLAALSLTVVGCENKPAEKPEAASAAPTQRSTPPPQVRIGPPGANR